MLKFNGNTSLTIQECVHRVNKNLWRTSPAIDLFQDPGNLVIMKRSPTALSDKNQLDHQSNSKSSKEATRKKQNISFLVELLRRMAFSRLTLPFTTSSLASTACRNSGILLASAPFLDVSRALHAGQFLVPQPSPCQGNHFLQHHGTKSALN